MNHFTLFECGFDLYGVEYSVFGAGVNVLSLYKIRIAVNASRSSETEFTVSTPTMFAFDRTYDDHVKRLFIEKYTPKAVKDRVS